MVDQGVGEAISHGDFEAFTAHHRLPYEISTSERREVISDLTALERMFRRNLAYFENDGVSEMSRRVMSASFVDDDTIWVLIETRLIHFGSQIKRAPYFVHGELQRSQDQWLFTSAHFAISGDPLHMAALVAKS